MHTIVFAASKGGVGKTTLCAALAVAGMSDGSQVAMIDADPQQSLAMWHAGRDSPDNPALIGNSKQSMSARNEAAKASGAAWCMIDTPPAMINVIEPCVMLASLVIIPCRPSPLDLLAIDPIVELCRLHEVAHLFVLNQTTPRSNYTEQAAKLLRKEGVVFEGEVGSRQNYAIAMVRGLTAPEIERGKGSAREEIETLWKSVKRRLARPK